MRKLTLLITTLFALSFNFTACGKDDNDLKPEIHNEKDNDSKTENKSMKLQVTIGETVQI